jgi:hypothetical protein
MVFNFSSPSHTPCHGQNPCSLHDMAFHHANVLANRPYVSDTPRFRELGSRLCLHNRDGLKEGRMLTTWYHIHFTDRTKFNRCRTIFEVGASIQFSDGHRRKLAFDISCKLW